MHFRSIDLDTALSGGKMDGLDSRNRFSLAGALACTSATEWYSVMSSSKTCMCVCECLCVCACACT